MAKVKHNDVSRETAGTVGVAEKSSHCTPEQRKRGTEANKAVSNLRHKIRADLLSVATDGRLQSVLESAVKDAEKKAER